MTLSFKALAAGLTWLTERGSQDPGLMISIEGIFGRPFNAALHTDLEGVLLLIVLAALATIAFALYAVQLAIKALRDR